MTGKKRNRLVAFIALIIVATHLFVGFYYQRNSPPKGDELHYLLVTLSIVRDHDLNIGNNYDKHDYAEFYDTEIDRHSVRGRGGGEYMFHGFGIFPILLVPGFALLGRTGVTLTILAAGLLFLWNLYDYLFEISKRNIASAVAVAFVALSLPMVQFTSLIFPDIVACLLVIIIARQILKTGHLTWQAAILSGFLPWLHIRYLPIAAGLWLASWIILIKRKRKVRIPYGLLSGVGIAMSYFLFYWYVFGTLDMRTAYREAGQSTEPGNIIQNIILALIDRQYGLFIYSPVFIFIIPGLVFWWKTHKYSLIFSLLPALLYLLSTFSYFDWNGGYAPPGRYLTAVIPILAPALVFAFSQANKRLLMFFSAAFAWGIFSFAILFFNQPNWGFVYMDGTSAFFTYFAEITHIERLATMLPAFYPGKQILIGHYVVIIVILIFSFIANVPRSRLRKWLRGTKLYL